MAKGSQLTQLKSALLQAGVTGKSSTSKKRKRGAAPLEKEKEKRAARLEEVHHRLNPFDVKVTKTKHDVGGRKIKGVTGRPAQSKQVGMEQRKKTLLKEWEERNRVGRIVDRRFGENNPTMSLEERMLERFTRERQRASKGVAFNLEDEDELTHYGQSLSKLDDFDNVGLGFESEDEEAGQLNKEEVSQTHFGGFGEDEEDDDDTLRRQMEKEQEENIRHELDNNFAALRDLLYAPDSSFTDSNAVPPGGAKKQNGLPLETDATLLSSVLESQDADYDQHVRELAFDKRSKPKDRTKTEEELALEEKEALEKAEKRRRGRMLDLEESENGDDEEDENGPGGNEGDETVDEEDHDFDLEDEADSEIEEGEQEGLMATISKEKIELTASTKTELPYTFPAPATHEEFLDIVENAGDQEVPIVVQRVRALYHTSLAPENKLKLQALANVLIDHIIYVTSLPKPRFPLVVSLLPHLSAIVKSYPLLTAQFFNEKLSLMHKNLKRGLARGATSPDARTWPGLSELSLLRIIGIIWPSSDFSHTVISPARTLMGAYLGLCRVRFLPDVASGLFLCSLFLQYESLSKRLVPETVNFLTNAFLHLAPTGFQDASSLPGSFPSPDFRSESCRKLLIKAKKQTPMPGKVNLPTLLSLGEPDDQAKVDLLALTLQLLGKFSEMYKGLDGFVELFEPVLDVIQYGETKNWDPVLKSRHSQTIDMLARLLKFAKQSHQPLTLQAHKPIPIPSFIPKFEMTTSNYLRKKDPDFERNEVAKLRYQLKQERKGAIRELRKDTKFLAAVEQKQQMEKDREYGERMKKAFTSIESERAEQKAMEREKAREKRRAGRK
ncbi:putative nucleolar complex protein 14 [Leucoagaricus sp. SymC.cos]|nr:putative nucleolar complex protein 14 [Leucoagaricus sp. SymC.cos]